MAQETFRLFPAKWLVRDRFDTVGRVAQIKSPLLIIHSRDDEIIPFQHGEQVFAAATEPKQFFEIEGGHNDGWYTSRNPYRAALAEFLRGTSQ